MSAMNMSAFVFGSQMNDRALGKKKPMAFSCRPMHSVVHLAIKDECRRAHRIDYVSITSSCLLSIFVL